MADVDADLIITSKTPRKASNDRNEKKTTEEQHALVQIPVTRFDKMIDSNYRFYGVRLFQ